MDYTTAHLVALVTSPPSAEFAERVALTTTAANALNAGMADTGSKLATQKMQTEIKKAFRGSLPGETLVVFGGLVAAVGPDSPIIIECFPMGRSIFTKCKEGEVDDYLQILVTGLGKHTTEVPASVRTKASSLLTTWNGIYEAASTAKGTKKTTSLSRQELRAALEAELFTNLLMLAILFPNDEVKAAQYCPKYLLETRAAPETPGAATLALQGYNAQTHVATFTLSAEGATSFRMYRRLAGEADLTQVSADVPATDGAATFSIVLEGPATYEFAAEGVNGTRVGEQSNLVSVERS